MVSDDEVGKKKAPFKCLTDPNVYCGNFASWEDFCHFEGEKMCGVICKKNLKRKDDVRLHTLHMQRYPKGARLQRVLDRQQPAYRRRLQGRQVA